jgi:hypothetical protein
MGRLGEGRGGEGSDFLQSCGLQRLNLMALGIYEGTASRSTGEAVSKARFTVIARSKTEAIRKIFIRLCVIENFHVHLHLLNINKEKR